MARWQLSVMCVVICLAIAGPSLGAGGSYDGTYTGKRVLTDGQASNLCPAEDDVTVTIKGNVLKFTHSRLQDYEITFAPAADGAFGQISTGGGITVDIQGRVTGDTLEADVNNIPTQCKYHWRLRKKP